MNESEWVTNCMLTQRCTLYRLTHSFMNVPWLIHEWVIESRSACWLSRPKETLKTRAEARRCILFGYALVSRELTRIIEHESQTISRIDQILGLSCRISSLLQGSFTKKTINCIDPTNRNHPIPQHESPSDASAFFFEKVLSKVYLTDIQMVLDKVSS